MASLSAYRSFRMDDIYIFDGVVTSASATKISLYDPYGSVSVNYSGTFNYYYGNLSSGILKSATVFDSGTPYYRVDGAYNVVTYSYYASGDDESGFKDFVFGGNDKITGSAENDSLDLFSFGGGGNDTIKGMAGNDYISTYVGYACVVDGGTGNDFIDAMGDYEKLSGGAGADTFFLMSGLNATIKDLKLSDGDTILLAMPSVDNSQLDSMASVDPYLTGCYKFSASQIAVGKGITKAQDSDDFVCYDLKTGKLYIDEDGLGGNSAELVCTLSTIPKITATQFANQVLVAYDFQEDSILDQIGIQGPIANFLSNNPMGLY